MPSPSPLLVVLGPTASGKTRLATHLAARLDGEVISADSRQFYKGMDIGTGKDLEEYVVGGKAIPYHLINILEAGAKYHINDFYIDFRKCLSHIAAREKPAILCGGSGLYLEIALRGNLLAAIPINEALRQQLAPLHREALHALLEALPENVREQADTSTDKRMRRAIEIGQYLLENPAPQRKEDALDAIIVGTLLHTEERRQRITARLEQRLQNGLIAEVEGLVAQGLGFDMLEYYGLEYRWVGRHLKGELSFQEMFAKLNTEIHRFAKRQMTWFRYMEKKGFHIHWVEANLPVEAQVDKVIALIGE